MFFHKMDDLQDAVLDAIVGGQFQQLQPYDNPYGQNYITAGGIEFSWLHGMSEGPAGYGKTVKLYDQVQPEWYAKRVRQALQDRKGGR